MNEEDTIDEFDLDEDEKRVANILMPGQKVEELPEVTWELLEKYYQYLSEKLPAGLLLTGQESLGYFSWEERFDWGYGSPQEHEQLRKKQASYHDTFKLVRLKKIDPVYGIVVSVSRVDDYKEFDIPLADLESRKKSPQRTLIDDYSMWFVNYN